MARTTKLAGVLSEAPRGLPWHEPGTADSRTSEAYRRVVAFKMAIDAMHEIPKELQPVYDQAGKALDALVKAQKETYQLSMLTTRLANRLESTDQQGLAERDRPGKPWKRRYRARDRVHR